MRGGVRIGVRVRSRGAVLLGAARLLVEEQQLLELVDVPVDLVGFGLGLGLGLGFGLGFGFGFVIGFVFRLKLRVGLGIGIGVAMCPSTWPSRMSETSSGSTSEAGMLSSVAMKPMRMRVYGLITLRSTCVRMFLRRSSMYSLMKGSPNMVREFCLMIFSNSRISLCMYAATW